MRVIWAILSPLQMTHITLIEGKLWCSYKPPQLKWAIIDFDMGRPNR